MSGYKTSVEYSTINIEDVNDVFETIVKSKPVFASMVPVQGVATNTKHEWMEHKKSPKQWTIDGATTAGTGTLTLDDTTGIKVGDVIKFTASTGASISVKAKVLTVASGTSITVTRPYGGTTDATISDNAVVSLVSRAVAENSTQSLDSNTIPTRKYNYTQIFRRDFGLSRTALKSAMHGLATDADKSQKVQTLVNFQINEQLNDIAYELNNSLIDGIREARADGGANGSMGGILAFLKENTSSVYDASSSAISTSILNSAIEKAVTNGANGSDFAVMLMHPVQARKISAFNTAGTNPQIVNQRGETTTGSYVVKYQSDLAGSNGGALSTIIVDRNFPQDKIAILDMSKIAIVPMENFSVIETTESKTDGRTWKILGEVTLEFKNYADGHMLVENLSL